MDLSVSKPNLKILETLLKAEEKGLENPNVHVIGEILNEDRYVCLSYLEAMKRKGLVNCKGAIKLRAGWRVTGKGRKCFSIASLAANRPTKTRIVTERKHLGITTTKETLTITGPSALSNVMIDTGTSVGLKGSLSPKNPMAGLDIASREKKRIEFDRE